MFIGVHLVFIASMIGVQGSIDSLIEDSDIGCEKHVSDVCQCVSAESGFLNCGEWRTM